jgi:hypothetical protein
MNAATMRKLRQFHLYIGVFFAPAIVFFAISGGLQTFRLQQSSGWNGAPAPQWIAWMASVHVDQAKLQPEKPEAQKPRPPMDPAKAAARAARQQAVLSMKLFTVAIAIALTLSSLLGAALALGMKATRRVALVMLTAGSVIPIMLLA